MSAYTEKIARLKAFAQQQGVKQVAAAPSKRPPDIKRLQAMRAKSEETVMSEFRRIIDLPIRYTPTPEEIDMVSRYYFQAHAYNAGWRLMQTQAESLLAYNDCQGAFLPLAVGGGKTLTSLLIANDAYKAGVERSMLIVPPALATQLCDTDIKHWRPLTIFNMPVHRLAGLDKHKRKALAKSGRRGLYIFSYSLLSAPDAHEILEDISPELIILDEAHSVARRSARTRRFTSYLHYAHPKVVALSGTMTQKSLMDYFELARACLGKNNFLPNSPILTEEWSKIIDTTATSLSDFRQDAQPKAGPLRMVINWAKDNFPDEKIAESVVGFRQGFQKRLTTCPGVVCSSGDDLPFSLYILNDPVEKHDKTPGWDRVQELVKQLDEEWKTPNGDEIEEAMHIFRWKYWIEGAGFYTERYWPDAEWLVEHHKADDLCNAKIILERSQEYHLKHMEYNRQLRHWLSNRAKNGLDTPMLVGKDMSLHKDKNVGPELFTAWQDWKDAAFDGMIERNKRAVRVCNFKIKKAVQWAKNLPKGEGGIVWYDNDEVGEWLFEEMIASGVDALFCKAGSKYNVMLDDRERCKGQVLICTINAHGTGKNLQFDRNMFYVQWPRSAKLAEQSIGRQHRLKQEYDEVFVTTCLTTEFDRVLYGATLNDAAYVHQSQGNKQKIIYATYAPKPEIVPLEVLLEWHVDDAKRLDKQAEMLLLQRFGK